MVLFQGVDESLGGSPGPQGMRAGRPDTYFKHVEYGDLFSFHLFAKVCICVAVGARRAASFLSEPLIGVINLFR
jgi:hypothetical protein